VQFGAHACTDVTGFSLMGHLAEMARASGVDVRIVWDDLPLFDCVLEYAAAGILPGAIERNKESCADRVVAPAQLPQEMLDICFDAQTSGGLLIAIEEEKASDLLRALHDRGVPAAAIIGRVAAEGSGLIHLETTGQRVNPPVGSAQMSQPPSRRVEDLPPSERGPDIRDATRPSAPAPGLTVSTTPSGESTINNQQSSIAEVPCCADALGPETPPPAGASSTQPGAAGPPATDRVKAAFKQFLGAASTPHALDAYTKQAIALALSVALRCEPCLKMHLKNARSKGFTPEEIDEAAWMGISFAGSPAMVFYEQIKGS
jgi:AhpD family alkylhydroperoxidase